MQTNPQVSTSEALISKRSVNNLVKRLLRRQLVELLPAEPTGYSEVIDRFSALDYSKAAKPVRKYHEHLKQEFFHWANYGWFFGISGSKAPASVHIDACRAERWVAIRLIAFGEEVGRRQRARALGNFVTRSPEA